ncbi:DinB family protein [Candidatus Nephthysia bennettiae]|uniref:DinB family protein n=1 Tax=Candidatus Nephthysia bennettiae TaxID=3127016 RepID=A0A934NEM0_9BACT|nr:DinB family protein [Candidatus Dormibacteraeota bacterium]MBJ7612628.1 DinB family protein [Candidatus Dormibacteraeota bacterium]
MIDLLDDAQRILSTTVGRWQSLVEAAPQELLMRPPAPGEWSAADCLNHLLVTEGVVFGFRLRAILEGRDLVSFDPQKPRDPEPERTPREVANALAAEREANLAVLKGLSPADLDRSSRHPDYGMVSLRVVLNTWAAHDLQHTVQAEEALMQAFIPGTGPFRFRFADHEVTT